MIIIVKTRGNKIKSLNGKLISETSKKSSYRINVLDLSDTLRNIYNEAGICKVKIVMEGQEILISKKKHS